MYWLIPVILAIAISNAVSLVPLFQHEEKLKDEYIVVMKHDGDVEDLISSLGNDVDRMHVQRQYRKVFTGFQARMTAESLHSIRLRPDVSFIEEDMIIRTQEAAATWGLDRIDQRDLPLDGQANFPGTGAGVTAYIIDTGIFPGNIYFEGRATAVYDAIDPQNGIDCNGHGTHVAGTIGSNPYGIAREANLYGVRVLNCMGVGTIGYIVAGMDYIAENHIGPSIASMSLGGPASVAIDDGIAGLVNIGVIVSVAAGNDNNDACLFSPSRQPMAITVGATQSDDTRATFSNYGTCVDIFAPGVNILSTWYTGDVGTNTLSGTSMSCPHVTGAACILLGNDPELSPAALKQKLIDDSTVNRIADVGPGSPNRLLFIGIGDENQEPNIIPKIFVQK